MLMDVPESRFHPILYFHLISGSTTALFMIGSEIVARCSRCSQPIPTNGTPTITNAIPFSTLNLSIVLAMVVKISISKLFGLSVANGIQLSVVLAALLCTNKQAQNHIRLRIRQKLDTLNVGRISRRVEPSVSIAVVPITSGSTIAPTIDNHRIINVKPCDSSQ